MILTPMSLEQLETLRNHSTVNQLAAVFSSYTGIVYLTGGAIIDIFSNRVPKDYDLVVPHNYQHLITFLLSHPQFKFKCTTKYATTFNFKSENSTYTIQVLHHFTDQFDFTISQGLFDFITATTTVFSGVFDNYSFATKELFPVSYEPKRLLNSLCRVTKYKSKGFKMSDITFDSVVNTLAQNNITSS